jgi:hypothetical protein
VEYEEHEIVRVPLAKQAFLVRNRSKCMSWAREEPSRKVQWCPGRRCDSDVPRLQAHVRTPNSISVHVHGYAMFWPPALLLKVVWVLASLRGIRRDHGVVALEKDGAPR